MTDDRDETPTQETLLENEWFKQGVITHIWGSLYM